MKLDDDVRRYLERQAALELPPATSLSPAELRERARALRPAGGPVIAVGAVSERAIPRVGGEVRVRVYEPTPAPGAAAAPAPLFVYFHGGGFIGGELDGPTDAACRRLCTLAGAVVVSVDYRLAPEHPFPAAAHDALAATRWCRENAAALGADPKKVFVGGDSAGGNLAAVAALDSRSDGLPPLAGQLLVYPVADLRTGEYASREECATGYGLTQPVMDWFRDHYLTSEADRSDPLASPLAATDLAGAPAALVITAYFDPLRSEGEEYAKRLAAAGVPVERVSLPGAIHGVFTAQEGFSSTERAWDAVAGWLHRRLGTSKSSAG